MSIEDDITELRGELREFADRLGGLKLHPHLWNVAHAAAALVQAEAAARQVSTVGVDALDRLAQTTMARNQALSQLAKTIVQLHGAQQNGATDQHAEAVDELGPESLKQLLEGQRNDT